jgi:hypothetical protein
VSGPQSKGSLPWFYSIADRLLLVFICLLVADVAIGATWLVEMANFLGEGRTRVIFLLTEVAVIVFGFLFACLAFVLLDAGKYLRSIADRLPTEERKD